MNVLPTCMYVYHIHVSCPWKGVSDVLKLELQMVVTHNVGAGNPLDRLPGTLYH